LIDRIYDNIGLVDDDEMPTLLRDELLAVLRQGQQIQLQFVVVGTAELVRADIDERLVPERVTVFLGDGVGFRSTFLA
jgi:hypothetical protein